ncbi:prepilin-type N-terminal cleavage/methylation domain-containing protein [Aliiglaciecola litoralis]|uniref:Prepilin-type N-terminal cleavage/methylation domain-containing protein n=1 Tax=Aliiglaciecola litoralis TaxID=582857 RepID=A0ABP3WPN1_9ALTE
MQKGFTLIELIIVIVILGILSAVALPRMIDVSSDAHIATSKFEAGTFKSAVDLVRNTYLVRNQNPLTIGAITIPIDTVSNWPTGSGSGTQFCVNLWNNLLANAEPVTGQSSPTARLAPGWNAFGNSYFCAYGKKFESRTFASGNLPHFVYYVRDVTGINYNGQRYEGSAGDVQTVNL